MVDGSDTVLASALKSLAGSPFQPGSTASVAALPGKISVTLLYNPEQRSVLFTIPGLLGVILTMPMVRIAQWLAEILPMTHFLRVGRGVILSDADFAAISADLAFLTVFFAVTLALVGFSRSWTERQTND